jgi:hypothetical protein
VKPARGALHQPQLCTSYFLATSLPVEMFGAKLNAQAVDLIQKKGMQE